MDDDTEANAPPSSIRSLISLIFARGAIVPEFPRPRVWHVRGVCLYCVCVQLGWTWLDLVGARGGVDSEEAPARESEESGASYWGARQQC